MQRKWIAILHFSLRLSLIRVHPCASVVPKFFLRAKAREYLQRRLFSALSAFADWTYAGGAAVFTGARGDQFTRLCQQQIVRAEQRLGEADSAGVRVIEIQVRLEEFFFQ